MQKEAFPFDRQIPQQNGRTKMAAKYELKTTANGKYIFNLKAGNGEVILTSQQYKAASYAKKGIASVKKNGPQKERFEIKDAANGQVYFVLKAANSQVIGKSELYPSKAVAEKGIASVMKNAADAAVVEKADA